MQLTRERGGEIEAEAVDVHLRDPVAERVHEQLEHLRVVHVERVAGARCSPCRSGDCLRPDGSRWCCRRPSSRAWAHAVAFAGVVVDDVEDDLDAGRVKGLDHLLELVDLAAGVAGRAVACHGREVAEGVVAPVIAEIACRRDGLRR